MLVSLLNFRDLVNLTLLKLIEIVIAHLSLKVRTWIIPDDLNEPPDVELFESLGDSHLHLLMPLGHLLGLTVITNVENIEALLEVQKLSESLEVH